MAIYCIWSGGDGTQTNTTQTAGTLDWSKADASVDDLIAYDAAAFTTSSNTIYFADDHNDPNKAAHWTLTGPTSGLPVNLISADRSLSTPTVKTGTGNQLSSLGGAYRVALDGAFALYEMRVASGESITSANDTNETFYTAGCTFVLGAAGTLVLGGSGCRHYNPIIDLTADGTTPRGQAVFTCSGSSLSGYLRGNNEILGATFINPAYRTNHVFRATEAGLIASGADVSGFASSCELVAPGGAGTNSVSNCITASTWTPFDTFNATSGAISSSSTVSNCGPADAPTYLAARSYVGDLLSSTDIYRTGGATVEGVACSWLITTTSSCSEHTPFYTPWRYGTLSSTGSKTFSVYITNDTADLNDNEIWLEVEYKSEATEAIWALATDQRATITTTAAAQTDDTASTWNGSGPSYTYKQKLSVTTTVNQVGQYRVRVAIGKTSVAGSAYLYIDPAVAVS